MTKPQAVTQEHLDYLDILRKSGLVNMFGAGVYLQSEFPELYKEENRDIVNYWMKNFKESK